MYILKVQKCQIWPVAIIVQQLCIDMIIQPTTSHLCQCCQILCQKHAIFGQKCIFMPISNSLQMKLHLCSVHDISYFCSKLRLIYMFLHMVSWSKLSINTKLQFCILFCVQIVVRKSAHNKEKYDANLTFMIYHSVTTICRVA